MEMKVNKPKHQISLDEMKKYNMAASKYPFKRMNIKIKNKRNKIQNKKALKKSNIQILTQQHGRLSLDG